MKISSVVFVSCQMAGIEMIPVLRPIDFGKAKTVTEGFDPLKHPRAKDGKFTHAGVKTARVPGIGTLAVCNGIAAAQRLLELPRV